MKAAPEAGLITWLVDLHSEPDLILHCQEIETYCNNLLPSTTQNDQEDKQQEAEIEIDEGKI